MRKAAVRLCRCACVRAYRGGSNANQSSLWRAAQTSGWPGDGRRTSNHRQRRNHSSLLFTPHHVAPSADRHVFDAHPHETHPAETTTVNGSVDHRHDYNLDAHSHETLEVPKESFFKRELPKICTSFSSYEGKEIFKEALRTSFPPKQKKTISRVTRTICLFYFFFLYLKTFRNFFTNEGHMENYFPLAAQYRTQSEPA